MLLLAICTSGVLAADPTVSITVSKWAIPPLAPTNFHITQTGVGSVNVTWTMGTAANITIVRGSTIGYPFSIFDGDAIYSGNSTYVEIDSLNLTENVYYYRAWSQNQYGTSATYAQASIGSKPEAPFDAATLARFIVSLIDGPMGITNMMFAVGLMAYGFWRKSWLRVMFAVSLIVWGVFAMPYDIKVAAPFIGIGALLFILGISQSIKSHAEAKEEVI
jgi:hypothetical protein